MGYTDSHCHLLKEFYDNVKSVINDAKSCGVDRFLVNADNYASSLEVLDLVDKYDECYGTIGLHPEYAQENFDFKIFYDNRNNKKIIAVGEIGLDYHYEGYSKEKQIEIFKKQLKIAEEFKMPVIIHSREATQDTLDILKEYKVKGLIHSFSGSYEVACEYIKMGFIIGINGVITFKNCKLKEVIKKIPLDKILLETDSPFLTPDPYRGKKNSPVHIIDIAKFVSDLYGVTLDELKMVTNKNFDTLFLENNGSF